MFCLSVFGMLYNGLKLINAWHKYKFVIRISPSSFLQDCQFVSFSEGENGSDGPSFTLRLLSSTRSACFFRGF